MAGRVDRLQWRVPPSERPGRRGRVRRHFQLGLAALPTRRREICLGRAPDRPVQPNAGRSFRRGDAGGARSGGRQRRRHRSGRLSDPRRGDRRVRLGHLRREHLAGRGRRRDHGRIGSVQLRLAAGGAADSRGLRRRLLDVPQRYRVRFGPGRTVGTQLHDDPGVPRRARCGCLTELRPGRTNKRRRRCAAV